MSTAECWTVRYDHWSLPIEIASTEQTTVVRVNLPPIPLLKKQVAALEYWLTKNCLWRREQGWYVERSILSLYASPSPGDPEDCVRWMPSRWKTETRPDFQEMEGFFETFAGAGWVKSPRAAEMLFHAFCRHMVFWLTAKKEPVDLQFCKLVPLPYRADWKQWVVKSLLRKKRVRYGRWYPSLHESTPETFRDVRLLGARTDRNLSTRGIVWTLEILPKAWWFRATERSERMTHRGFRRHGFARLYWLDALEKMVNATANAEAVFEAYRKQAAFPRVVLHPDVRIGMRIPVTKGSLASFPPPEIPEPVATEIYGGERAVHYRIDLSETSESVPEMRAIRPGAVDMRHSRPPGQEWKPDGVPMSDETESQAGGG